MLVPLRKAVELTGLHPNTLRKYADNGTIEAKRVGRQRLYSVVSLKHLSSKSSVVCYTRVSSAKQKDDLSRQVVYMREKFPRAEIIQDVGSGLNFKRTGFRSILERCLSGDTITLIVAHRDRLCRFGFEIVEYLINKNGGEILVLDKDEHSPERELTEDLLAILHVFSCRMHGLRRYSKQIEEDKGLSNSGPEESV
jgi:predicted site-specific integrase-resolvase